MAFAGRAGAVLDVWRSGRWVTWSGLVGAADVTAHLSFTATFSRTLEEEEHVTVMITKAEYHDSPCFYKDGPITMISRDDDLHKESLVQGVQSIWDQNNPNPTKMKPLTPTLPK